MGFPKPCNRVERTSFVVHAMLSHYGGLTSGTSPARRGVMRFVTYQNLEPMFLENFTYRRQRSIRIELPCKTLYFQLSRYRCLLRLLSFLQNKSIIPCLESLLYKDFMNTKLSVYYQLLARNSCRNRCFAYGCRASCRGR